MFTSISDTTQQIFLLFDTGEGRLPVKIVSAVSLASKNRRSTPTVGCRKKNKPKQTNNLASVLCNSQSYHWMLLKQKWKHKFLILTCIFVAFKINDGHSLEAGGARGAIWVDESQISIWIPAGKIENRWGETGGRKVTWFSKCCKHASPQRALQESVSSWRARCGLTCFCCFWF